MSPLEEDSDHRGRRQRLWRIGILSGTGTARKRTIPALQGSETCRVSVVHGRNGDRLKQVIDLDATIRLTSSEREFAELRDEYDVVYIASPPFLHRSHLMLATELGKPVICEKPLVARREDLAAVLELIETNAMQFMVAHHLRHQPAVTDMIKLLESRRLGAPVAANLQWCFTMDHQAPNAGWKLDPTLGGSNAMFDCGVHAIDLAVLFFGAPDRVGAVAHQVRSMDVLDSVTAVLDYGAFSVTVLASQSASSHGNDLRVTFERSMLRAEGLLREQSLRGIDIVRESGVERLTYEPVNLYRAEVEDFCRSLDIGSIAIGTSTADAALTLRILFAIEDALHAGRMIDL
jgi:predicted dehydrogenase